MALENVVGISRAGQMVLNLLDRWTGGDGPIRQMIPQLIGLTTVTEDAVKLAGEMLNKSSRLGFVVLCQFQIENALRNIARELELVEGAKGFYGLAKSLADELGLPEDRLDILLTPARIRNSLHSNGIHRRQHSNESAQVTIGGVVYSFRDGWPVTCASWEHAAHALEASIGVLDEMCSQPSVRSIQDPIMDQYAWEQETGPGKVI